MPGFRLASLMTAAAVAASLPLCAATAQESVPFRTRNLNPLVSIHGMPTWEIPGASREFGLTSELANHYRLSRRGEQTLLLDGETWRTSFHYSMPVGDRWTVGFELPVYHQSGGILDDLIDGWHTTFDLPDGGRNNREDQELLFQMGDGDGVFYHLDERDHGLGGVRLRVGRSFGADNGFHANLSVKLPTGKESVLAGSGSADWATTLLRTRQVSFRSRAAGYFWGFGAIRPGAAKQIAFDAERQVFFGTLGGGLALTPRLGVRVQLDAHTPFYDTPLEEIGQTSVQLALGGWWRTGERSVIEFAVNEDLHASTAPDVVMHVGLRWSL